MTNPTIPSSVRVLRRDADVPSGSRRDSPVKTLQQFEQMISAAHKGSTVAGRVVLDSNGKEFAINLYIRNPQRNLVKKLWDFARGHDIERRGNAKRAVERLLARFEAEPGATESVRQIRAQMEGKKDLKTTPALQKAVGRLAAGNLAAEACIKDFVALKPSDSRALKAQLGSINARTNRAQDLDPQTLSAMQAYVSNRLAVQSHNKVALDPKRLEVLDLKTESAKLPPLKNSELERVAEFAKIWLDAYRKDPNLVPNNPNPQDRAMQVPTWRSEVHDIVLAFAKARPDLMDEVIGARHTPDSLKLAEFRECAMLFGLPLPKGELKRELAPRLNQLGTALQKEIYENPEIKLLFETSDPKAFKQYLFREFIAQTGTPVNPDGKPQVAAPLSITFLQLCRRAGAAADYLYLDVLSKLPDRLDLNYGNEMSRLLDLMDAGNRAPREKRVKDDIRRVDVHGKGFKLGNVKYTRVTELRDMQQFTIFQDKDRNRVAVRTIPKTINEKPNPDYDKQLVAFRSGARMHSQLSAAGDNAAIESLAIIPGPNGELLHVVEMPVRALSEVPGDAPAPGERVGNRWNEIRLAFIGAVEAVASVHRRNVIHQGLSEDNFGSVLRNGESRFVLTGFDSAAKGKAHKIFEPHAASFEYAAPEMVRLQYSSELEAPHPLPDLLATQKADMWALGVMLFKMHVGKAPFEEPTDRGLLPSDLEPYNNFRYKTPQLKAIPAEAQDLIRRLLSWDPAARPSADDLQKDPYFDRKNTIRAAALTGLAAMQRRKSSDPNNAVATNATTPAPESLFKSYDQSFEDSHVRDNDESEDVGVAIRKRTNVRTSSYESSEDSFPDSHVSPRSNHTADNIDGADGSDSRISEGSDDQLYGSHGIGVTLHAPTVKASKDLEAVMNWPDDQIKRFAGLFGCNTDEVKVIIQCLEAFSGQTAAAPALATFSRFAIRFIPFVNEQSRSTSPAYAAILAVVNAFYKANPHLQGEPHAKSGPFALEGILPSGEEGSEAESTDGEESSTGKASSGSDAYGTTRIAQGMDDLDGGTTRLLSPAIGGAPGGDIAAAVLHAARHDDGFNRPEPGLGKPPRQFRRITTDRNDVFTAAPPSSTAAAATSARATAATATATTATTATKAAKDPHSLKRFVDAQDLVIDSVRKELRSGRKQNHWIWYIFPQIAGLGLSENSKRYAISSLDEAKAYLADPVLGSRLVECCNLMLKVKGDSAFAILGSPDDVKFQACLTLFSRAGSDNPVFAQCLDKFFDGVAHRRTNQTLGK
ncbi:MAG: hypothetical protein JWR22_1463 [Herminiimonas sp.]|nr:hypothetical protein [Herminiimonas sp.]